MDSLGLVTSKGASMTRHEIDTMWQRAMRESIRDGEVYSRYHFAKKVAEKAIAELESQELVNGVVIREGLTTLLKNSDIKSTDHRLYTAPQPAVDLQFLRQVVAAGIAILFEHYKEDVVRTFNSDDLETVVEITEPLKDQRAEDFYKRAWDMLNTKVKP